MHMCINNVHKCIKIRPKMASQMGQSILEVIQRKNREAGAI